MMTSYPEAFGDLCCAYRDESDKCGRELALGEGVGAFRSISIGKTYDEAFALGARTTGWGFYAYFSQFGFMEVFRNPDEEGPEPLTFESPEAVYQRLVDHDFALCGTVDDVKRKLDSLAQIHADGELSWLSWSFPQGLLTWDEARWQLESFVNEIMPAFSD